MANSDDACSSASLGLPNINLIKSSSLPEQWALPNEWNMEKRELFANWKLDVQSQIAHLDKKLKTSLGKHPNEVCEEQEYPALVEPADDAERHFLQSALRGRMQNGLRRS